LPADKNADSGLLASVAELKNSKISIREKPRLLSCDQPQPVNQSQICHERHLNEEQCMGKAESHPIHLKSR
jgi:hypothetical protein